MILEQNRSFFCIKSVRKGGGGVSMALNVCTWPDLNNGSKGSERSIFIPQTIYSSPINSN